MKKELKMQKENKIISQVQKNREVRKFLIIGIISILLVIMVSIIISVFVYFNSPEKQIGISGDIKSFMLSEDSKISYLGLKAGSLDKNISKVKFVFRGDDDYVYETAEGAQEISVPYKESFWGWLFGREKYNASYDYSVSAGDLGLENFNDIENVSVVFVYEDKGVEKETDDLDTQKKGEEDDVVVGSPGSSSPSSGGGGGSYCGDGTCDADENCENCEEDCGECPTECGNDIIESGEACDGSGLEKTCGDFGFLGGEISCLDDCSDYNTSSCIKECKIENNCYYISVTGAGSHNGSEGNEMNLSEAKTSAQPGDTFLLLSGDYGEVSFDKDDSRGTDWDNKITYKAAPGSEPNLTSLSIEGKTDERFYLMFEGLHIMPIDTTADQNSDTSGIFARAAFSLYFKDCVIKGNGNMSVSDELWPAKGISIVPGSGDPPCKDITIDGCEVSWVNDGIDVSSCNKNVMVKNSYIHDITSSGITATSAELLDRTIIENNVIDTQLDPPDCIQHGSGIVIREDPVTIRGNIIYNHGNTGAITWYNWSGMPENGYQDMVVENNLVYNSIGNSVVRFRKMGNNCTIRNNIFAGVDEEGYANDDPRRYMSVMWIDHPYNTSVYDKSTMKFYNNIFIGTFNPTQGYDTGGNIIWSSDNDGTVINNEAPNDLILTSSAGMTSGYESNYFENSGTFFAGGSDFADYAYKGWNKSSPENSHDISSGFKHKQGSDAIGFGVLSESTSTDILGNTRDSNPDAGCYEYQGSNCGNGIIENEKCDDSNIIDGDGCSSSCLIEDGWTCSGEPSVCEEGNVYHVAQQDPGCDDSNPGTSDEPWCNLSRAMINYGGAGDKVQYGDTVILYNGDYGPFHLPRTDLDFYEGDPNDPSPTEWDYVTYKAAEEGVYFDYIVLGDEFEGPYKIAHSFIGIDIINPPKDSINTKPNCVRMEEGVGLRLKNMTLQGVSPEDIKTGAEAVVRIDPYPNKEVTISNCDISQGFKGINCRATNTLIKDCNVHDTVDDRLNIGTGYSIVIQDNFLHSPLEKPELPNYLGGEPHPDLIQFSSSEPYINDIIVRRNKMYNHSSQGLWCSTDDNKIYNLTWENNLMYRIGNYEMTVSNVIGGNIRHNTFVGQGNDSSIGADYSGFRIHHEPGTEVKNLNVYNNLIVMGYTLAEEYQGTNWADYHDYNIGIQRTTSSKNVFWNSGHIEYEPNSIFRQYELVVDYEDEISAMKKEYFNNPDAEDFTLKPGSNAIDFGTNLRDYPETDIEGNPRDANPDAGCYEYQGEDQKNVYYCDPENGNDSWQGNSTHPWETIAHAEENAEKGSTVYLKTGTYPFETIDRTDNSGRNGWDDAITFKPAENNMPMIEGIEFEKDVDRYLIFDGLTFSYPEGEDIFAVNVIKIENSDYFKFLNCTVNSTLGTDEGGQYWQQNSVENLIQIGRYGDIYGEVNDVRIENCELYKSGTCGIKVEGIIGSNIVIKNNDIHHIGHAEIKLGVDTVNGKILVENNKLHDQIPVWTIGHSTTHHTSSIYIASNNLNIRNNIIRGGGSTNPITTYQEITDGGVYYGGSSGSLNDPNHNFFEGDIVTQEVTGATGIVHKAGYGSAGNYYLRIYRSQEKNIFDKTHNITNDNDPEAIYIPGEFLKDPREYGGYKNITIVNNLIYDSRNSAYVTNFQDIGKNFKFNHNTVIGTHVNDSHWSGVGYYKNAFRGHFPVSGGHDPNTIEICNNVFVGYAGSDVLETDGVTAVGNIFYALYNNEEKIWRNQTFVDNNLPGNKVYNWKQGEGNKGQFEFNTSGEFFIGGRDFDEYSYKRSYHPWAAKGEPTDRWPHQQDLGDSYAPADGSFAIGYADATYTPSTDILGNPRDSQPDAGCYEYQGAGVTTLSPLTKLWNFIKGLLSEKTGKAILTGEVIGDGGNKKSYAWLGLMVVSLLIIIIVWVVKVRRGKKKKIGRKKVGKGSKK